MLQRVIFTTALRYRNMSTAPRQRWLVYAPDKTEEGTFEKRMSVRPTHIENASSNFQKGIVRVGGGLLTPESVATPDAPKKLIGSVFICEADNIDQYAPSVPCL
ncbi:hypothetical protein D9756_007461 [Leucocoprinus leucothites]|uniref:YCII-related domain-containing protein n=1 Tax=Leucocoprinus leucothites TaxID=201217 RepID=A0A8H5D3W2_9AGAR|nr:hypothetical protein D9756_007461 [Leucoagaricus leucothites]